ncbi:MAG: two component transcriptional regulator, LuxR family [Frankiales bacterium]|nr:two component transcriptional regulator, LuxR family [Frankiales bacterium]
MIRILLVDDQPLMRMGFRMILSAEPDFTIVGEASDGQVAVSLTKELEPDVILMDVRMPGTDGVAATRQIVQDRPQARVLILTTFDLDEYAFSGLQAGASGFLLKDVPPAELTAAIRAVASGDAVVSPRVTRRLLDTFASSLRPGEDAGPDHQQDPRLAQLTQREHEVLEQVAAGLSNAEIAAALFVTEATVKTHITRTLSKLELRDRVQAVVFAYQQGIVHP